MCSINEHDYNDISEVSPQENIAILRNGRSCQKCNGSEASVKLRGKDVYCETCFLVNTTHKFRATLGKSKIVRPTDNILVGHSGRGGSTALLHLIRAGMHESVHKRLVFQTKVIYVDDGMVGQRSAEERQRIIKNIAEQIKPLGFQVFVASLSENFNKTVIIDEIDNYLCTSTEANDKHLIEMFNKLSNDTSKQDLLRKLRQKVIISAAKFLGCVKVFLADDATSLAISILSNVSLGRGAQLSLDAGFIDDRHSDVMILRPMRDFVRHELNCYLNIHRLDLVNYEKVMEPSHPHASIQQLTEQFVTELDSQFGGTVSTIFRTSEKLSAGRGNPRDDRLICILCNAIMDTTSLNDVTSAIEATTFSRSMSSEGAKSKLEVMDSKNVSSNFSEKSVTNCCGECQGDSCSKSKQMNLTIEDIRKCLCYGCRLIFQEQFDFESLPFFVINSAQQRLHLETMHEQINDFLL